MPKLFDPARYWERRYRDGRTSGSGSEGATARHKAQYVNGFIDRHEITSIIDWGCGDGTVLSYIRDDIQYLGLDVSPTVLDITAAKCGAPSSRAFMTVDEYKNEGGGTADMALSMDVLFHFPDDSDYLEYLHQLFGSATKAVLIYATNYDGGQTARHVKRRHFTPDIERLMSPQWCLYRGPEPRYADDTNAHFYEYRRSDRA